jgi:ribosomal protein S18 acetylase RimI-like enzyme
MNRVRHEIVVRPLDPADSRQMLALLYPTLFDAPYSRKMDNVSILDQCFQPSPPTAHESRWLQHHVLGAWNGDALVGFIDLGVGYDRSTLHLSGERPLGLLRFMGLPEDYILAGRTAKALLQAADLLWQEAGVRRIRAFSLSTGYPAFQSGAGVLPSTWEDHFRWLSETGYRLVERYYCFCYPLHRLSVEILPERRFSLWPQQNGGEITYQVLEEDARVALARMSKAMVLTPEDANPVGYLAQLEVAPQWRQQGIGRWLLRRAINDAFLMGCKQLVLHVNHSAHAAISLFNQTGLEEINYRGYTLEKRL